MGGKGAAKHSVSAGKKEAVGGGTIEKIWEGDSFYGG